MISVKPVAAFAALYLFSAISVQAGSESIDQEMLNLSLRQEAISGVIPRIEQLVAQGAEINGKAPHGETALEYAIRFGRYGAALKLIQLGADPNTEDDSGLSPLLQAAGSCNASRVADALLRNGAEVNHRDLYGRTALMNAAHADCGRMVAVILLRGKDSIEIEAENDSGESASDLSRDGLVSQLLDLARRYQENGSGDLVNFVESIK